LANHPPAPRSTAQRAPALRPLLARRLSTGLVALILLTVSWSVVRGQGVSRKPQSQANPAQLRVDDAPDRELPRVPRLRLPAAEPIAPLPVDEPLPAAALPDAQPQGWPMAVQPEQLVSPGGLSSTLNVMLLLTVLSLAPSILMMTTCFIRFVIVFGLLRQALGTQQLPPNQILVGLSLFLTCMVMAPVWRASYAEGIAPYTQPAPGQSPPSLQVTFNRTVGPLRRFMSEQIETTGNSDTVWLFLDYTKPAEGSPEAEAYTPPATYDDVPLTILLPSYMLSELKTAFLIGFQLFLPFLVIDMVVASLLMTMGMMMLPPTLVSFPFKLLLFVLIDGWYLTVGMLLESIRP
jgi:flagellar biosynthetic protein FliP